MVIDLKTLYGAEAAEQQKRYEELSAYFAEEFGDANALSYFSAPGRTEVGGNHTDHNNGKVLAAALPARCRRMCRSICWTRSRQRCRACLAKRAAMCSPCAARAARK